MCVDSGIKRFNYQYKIISFLSRLVHLSNKKKNVGEFFQSSINVCIEVQRKEICLVRLFTSSLNVK